MVNLAAAVDLRARAGDDGGWGLAAAGEGSLVL